VAKKIYVLYCRKAVDWEEEFRFHASGIEEARSFAYVWANRQGIGMDRVGVKENTPRYPSLITPIRPKRSFKIVNEARSA
jgi:hypothetical protein